MTTKAKAARHGPTLTLPRGSERLGPPFFTVGLGATSHAKLSRASKYLSVPRAAIAGAAIDAFLETFDEELRKYQKGEAA